MDDQRANLVEIRLERETNMWSETHVFNQEHSLPADLRAQIFHLQLCIVEFSPENVRDFCGIVQRFPVALDGKPLTESGELVSAWCQNFWLHTT